MAAENVTTPRELAALNREAHDAICEALRIIEQSDLAERPDAAAKLPSIASLAQRLEDELRELTTTPPAPDPRELYLELRRSARSVVKAYHEAKQDVGGDFEAAFTELETA